MDCKRAKEKQYWMYDMSRALHYYDHNSRVHGCAMNPITLGECLKVMRSRKKLSQTDLGKLVGVHRTTIAAIEDNDPRTKLSTLIAVAEALGFKLQIDINVKEKENEHTA